MAFACSLRRLLNVELPTATYCNTFIASNPGDLQGILIALKRLGVGLVVDDFGIGYSSLDCLIASPFDALKIDRSFVHDLETNIRHRAILDSVSLLAHDLGLRLIAEG